MEASLQALDKGRCGVFFIGNPNAMSKQSDSNSEK